MEEYQKLHREHAESIEMKQQPLLIVDREFVNKRRVWSINNKNLKYGFPL